MEGREKKQDQVEGEVRCPCRYSDSLSWSHWELWIPVTCQSILYWGTSILIAYSMCAGHPNPNHRMWSWLRCLFAVRLHWLKGLRWQPQSLRQEILYWRGILLPYHSTESVHNLKKSGTLKSLWWIVASLMLDNLLTALKRKWSFTICCLENRILKMKRAHFYKWMPNSEIQW